MEKKRKAIFLLDDSVSSLETGSVLLSDLYDVNTFDSGAVMFKALKKKTPDLILLDIEMPEMDGYEVIKRLKKNQHTADIPVIFLTVHDNEEAEIKGFSLGAADYVAKPFSASRLLKRIEAQLALKELRDAEQERIRAMLDSSPMHCALFDEYGNCLEVNQAALDFFGFTEKQQYIDNFSRLVPEYQPDGTHTLTAIRENNMKLMNGEIEGGKLFIPDWIHQTPDGNLLPVEVTLTHIKLGGKDVIIAHARDRRMEVEMLAELEAARERELEQARMRVEMESITRQRFIYDSIPIPASMWSDDYQVLDCNEAMVNFLGMPNKEEALRRFYEFSTDVQPCGTPTVEKCMWVIDKVINEGVIVKHHWNHLVNGEIIPVEVAVERVPMGEKYVCACYAFDLRPIREAMDKVHALELKLRKQEVNERMKLMFDSTPLMIEFWDKDCNLIDCNKGNLDFWGYTEKNDYMEYIQTEVFRESEYDIFSHRKDWNKNLKEIFESGHGSFEFVEKGPGSKPAFLEVDGIRMKYNDEIVVITYSKDVTRLKENERTIAQAQEVILYREKLLDTVNKVAEVLVSVTDDAGFERALTYSMDKLGFALEADRLRLWTVTEANETIDADLLSEWPSGVALGDDSIVISPQICRKWKQVFMDGKCINSSYSEMEEELQTLLNPTGMYKSVAIIPVVLQNTLWGFFAIEYSRSDHILSTEELDILRSASLMIASTSQRVKQAQEMQRIFIAEESNRAKSRFLARMSHEIRTPISAVVGISEIQLQNPNLHPTIEESFAKIHNSSNILLEIINDILDLSKIEAGKMSLMLEEYEVASLINDTVQPMIMQFDNKNIAFNMCVDEDIPMFLIGDPLRIKQILNNILSNAFKYSDSGSIDFTLKCENKKTDNVTLVISVRDTGLGMTPEQVDMLFKEEYIRFHEQESSAGGTGLGMTIVHNLVQMMNAQIEVESKVGIGTTVTVRIPQKTTASTEVLGKEMADNLSLFKSIGTYKKYKFVPEYMPYGRVLVVDDVDANLYVAKGLLSFYGLHVDTCESGSEAIDKIKHGNVYDIVFMDQTMPGLNGTQTMHILRDMGYTHPIVALTADALIGQAEEFIKSGFDGFISKPIQTVHLNTILIKYIKDKHSAIATANAVDMPVLDIHNFQYSSELINKLRLDFAKKYSNVCSEISSAMAVEDTKTAHRLAHSLKTVAGLIHEYALAKAAEEVEDLLREEKSPTDAQMSALLNELTPVLAGIGKSKPVSPPIAKALDKNKAIALFDELAPLLKSRNSKCLNFLDELGAIPGTSELVRRIEDFEFIAALESMNILRAIWEE